MSPRVPVVGKAVDHDHQWPFAEGGVVDLDAITVSKAVLHALVKFSGGGFNATVEQANKGKEQDGFHGVNLV